MKCWRMRPRSPADRMLSGPRHRAPGTWHLAQGSGLFNPERHMTSSAIDDRIEYLQCGALYRPVYPLLNVPDIKFPGHFLSTDQNKINFPFHTRSIVFKGDGCRA